MLIALVKVFQMHEKKEKKWAITAEWHCVYFLYRVQFHKQHVNQHRSLTATLDNSKVSRGFSTRSTSFFYRLATTSAPQIPMAFNEDSKDLLKSAEGWEFWTSVVLGCSKHWISSLGWRQLWTFKTPMSNVLDVMNSRTPHPLVLNTQCWWHQTPDTSCHRGSKCLQTCLPFAGPKRRRM